MGKTNKTRKYMDEADYEDAMFRKNGGAPSIEEGMEDYEREQKKQRLEAKKAKLERIVADNNFTSMAEKRRIEWYIKEADDQLKELE